MFSSLAHYLPELSAEASIVALLALAVLSVLLMRALRLPSMLAYLLIGVFITATGIDLLPGDDDVSEIGEFGIAFLMFSIGLEFNVAKLLQMRHLVLGLGPAQMLLTALGTMLVTWFGYDQGWRPGLAVGLAVAMSSTAIMAKLLSERFELHSHHGKRTMAVLLFQDLAVVPCLIVIPALAMNPDNLGRVLGISLIVTVVTLLLMFWLGRKLVNQLLAWFLGCTPRAFHADGAAAGIWALLHDRKPGAFASDGSLHRRHSSLRDHVPARGRSRHPPFPGHHAGAVLCFDRHDAESQLCL